MSNLTTISSSTLDTVCGGRGITPRTEAKAGAFDFLAGGGPAGPAGSNGHPISGGSGGGGGGGGGKGWLLDPQKQREMIIY